MLLFVYCRDVRKNANQDRAAEGERRGLQDDAGIRCEKTEDSSQQRLKWGVKVELWVSRVKKANQPGGSWRMAKREAKEESKKEEGEEMSQSTWVIRSLLWVGKVLWAFLPPSLASLCFLVAFSKEGDGNGGRRVSPLSVANDWCLEGQVASVTDGS